MSTFILDEEVAAFYAKHAKPITFEMTFNSTGKYCDLKVIGEFPEHAIIDDWTLNHASIDNFVQFDGHLYISCENGNAIYELKPPQFGTSDQYAFRKYFNYKTYL